MSIINYSLFLCGIVCSISTYTADLSDKQDMKDWVAVKVQDPYYNPQCPSSKKWTTMQVPVNKESSTFGDIVHYIEAYYGNSSVIVQALPNKMLNHCRTSGALLKEYGIVFNLKSEDVNLIAYVRLSDEKQVH